MKVLLNNPFLYKWFRYPEFTFWILAFFMIVPFNVFAKKLDDIFIKAEVSKKNTFVDEPVVLTYNLYSKIPEISFAKRIGESVLKKGETSFSSQVEVDSRGRRVNLGDETYYVFPIEKYIVSFDKKGNYSFEEGRFEVGINKPVVYEDPFWGRRRGYKTEKLSVPVEEAEIKVKSLPASLSSDGVTAVGVYEVALTLPPGDIILQRPARAVITVKGYGILTDDILPRYSDAFHGEGIRLKSMSETRNKYFDGKNIISELVLDCEFIPSEKEVEIGSVYFDFFNTETGKVEKARSEPVTVRVKSITSKVETVDI